jgi:hypothetical protein
MANAKSQRAIKSSLNKVAKDGTAIILQKKGQDIKPTDVGFDISDPAGMKGVAVNTNLKAFIFTEPSRAILALDSVVIGAFKLSMKLYTTEVINKLDYKIIYDNETYEITFISKRILADEIILYELLVSN